MPKTEAKKRLPYLDIAKGILIILVALGHSSFLESIYVYWFHIPAFFMISGLLHSQPKPADMRPFLIRKIKRLLIPYLAFGLSVIAFLCLGQAIFHTGNPLTTLAGFTGRLLYGGRVLFGSLGTFWFINCLIITVIVFTLLKNAVSNQKYFIGLMLAIYIAGYYLLRFKDHFWPWSINIVPISLLYYSIGYYSKSIREWLVTAGNKIYLVFLGLVIACSSLIYLYHTQRFFFWVDMKIAQFSNPFLAVFVPVLFTVMVVIFSFLLQKTFLSKPLAYLGLSSLVIMYVHYPFNNALAFFAGRPLPVPLFVITGIIGSVIINELLQLTSFTRRVFLGKNEYPAGIPNKMAIGETAG